ncbi:nucleotidyltransferase domain-containing protein [Methanogenium organophilum]|uniref:Nucleotidyltransferase domain-containing protein n=1 Tax=Methanogenium organophilum TaxID=2199 RepID=A0A9X9S5E9_METOG|nr:nucleotidyltransferase domain-containing protein [Methanogenium organophilum]WAI01822.1 nucleotidyltransferase domain-containing protein [Methanogenium organophilum]
MSKNLDINENSLMVLSVFSNGYDNEYYIREMCRHLPISHGTAQTILVRLEEKRVLTSSQRGKIRLFRIKPGEIATQYFTITEIYKKIRFMENEPYISEILTKISAVSEGIVLLFGSYANGTATEDSDIDIFIAGTTDKQAIKNLETLYHVEINVIVYPIPAFTSQEEFDPLITEVKKNHIIWKNAESFVRDVLK